MAEPDIERLITNAQMRLPGALAGVMQQELFMVADEFFKTSKAWQEDILFPVLGTDVAGFVYEIVPIGPTLINDLYWIKNSGGGDVKGFMQTPGEITLKNQPSQNDTYTAHVALTVVDPTRRDGYVFFPLWVLEKYRETFLDGLLGKMMSQPNKPYTNTQMSVYHLRRFESGKSAARNEVKRANLYGAQAWSYPRQFAVSQQRRGEFR